MASALTRTGSRGIYYPDFFFIDEVLGAPERSYEDSPATGARKHVDQMKWLLLCNDFIHIPMDNFVFIATRFLQDVRERFLRDADVGWMMEHGLVSTNEHGALDPRATLQLYRARRVETNWSLRPLDCEIDAALIARLPTSKSDPGAQVISFDAALANVMGQAEYDLLDRYRTLETIVAGARKVYGEGDISVEHIGEQLRKSDLPDAQQNKLLLSTRNIFYRSFAPVDRLTWYSAAVNLFEVREAAYGTTRTQCVSYLYSPTFIESWFRMFLPPAEIRTLLRAFPAIYHELRYTSLHSYMVEFKDYYHRQLVTDLDGKLADAYGTGDLGAADPTRMKGGVSIGALEVVNGLLAAGTVAITGFPLIAAGVPLVNKALGKAGDRYQMKNVLTNVRRPAVREFLKQLRQLIRCHMRP